MSDSRNAAAGAIDPVEFLHQLVATESLSGQESNVANLLVDTMRQCGFESAVDAAGNAVGRITNESDGGNSDREIVLLGHMDTVPGEIEVRVSDGALYGRGSVDAKGPLATFVIAAARAKLPPGLRVIVIGAVEEETATSKGARFAAKQYQPDLCIIGEPSGWDAVTIGYKGRVLIDYELSRPMGHSAGQQSGVAESAIDWWNRLSGFIAQFNVDKPKLFDQLIPSIRIFQTSSDGITDTAQLKVGVRLPPDFDCDGFLATVTDWADEARLEHHGRETAFQSQRTTALARAFNIALRSADVRPRYKFKTGTCDMNVVGPVWNCPIVAYGPGDSSLDHTPDEHVVIDDYFKAIEILTAVLESC